MWLIDIVVTESGFPMYSLEIVEDVGEPIDCEQEGVIYFCVGLIEEE